VIPPRGYKSSKSESKDTEIIAMLGKELKNIVLKMVNELEGDLSKQKDEMKTLIQDLDEKVNNMYDKFWKKIEKCGVE
jgi:phosphate uptake regulator